jgi:hypothetical protein
VREFFEDFHPLIWGLGLFVGLMAVLAFAASFVEPDAGPVHPDLTLETEQEWLARKRSQNKALEACAKLNGVPVRGWNREVECIRISPEPIPGNNHQP